MSNIETQIKALHFFDLPEHNGTFIHTQTAVVHEDGFQFIVRGVSDEAANKRVEVLMERTKKKRIEREAQGKPFGFDDYLAISQIGQNHRFVGSTNTYSSLMSLQDIVEKERLLLNQGGVKYVSPKGKSINSKKQLSELIFPPMTPAINSDIQQVFEDYPSLVEEFVHGKPDINTPGFVEFLFAKLGPVDPKGPNGWFLDLFDENGNIK